MKYYGVIGFAELVETAPGVYEEEIKERNTFGDLLRNTRRLNDRAEILDNVTISNQLSIIADAYALKNFHNIRYITYLGTKWKVTSVEVNHPRLTLEIGGVYNA